MNSRLPTVRNVLCSLLAGIALAAPVALAQNATDVRSAIRTAVETGEREATALEAGDSAWRAVPAVADRYEAARQQIRESKKWIEAKTRDAAALEAQAKEAEMAAGEIQRIALLARESRDRLADPAEILRRDQLRTELQQMIRDGARFVAAWRARRNPPRRVRENAPPYFAALDAAVARGRAAVDGPVEEIRDARNQLADTYDRAAIALDYPGPKTLLPAATAPPKTPDALRNAVAAWLEGRYDDVGRLLEGGSFLIGRSYRPRRLEAQRYLFLSAAAYARFQLSGGADATLRTAAESNAKKALEYDVDLVPSPNVFSPRFRLFFESQR